MSSARLDEDLENFHPDRTVAIVVALLAAFSGYANNGLPTACAAVAAGETCFWLARRHLRSALFLITIGSLGVLLPTYQAACAATVFGAACGWFVGAAARRGSDIDAQSASLNEQTELLANSQLEIFKSDEVSRYLLAADLHDQSLNDQKSLAEHIRAHRDKLPQQQYTEIITTLSAVMTETREIMDKLYPAHLSVLGLSEALDTLLTTSCRKYGCKARFRDKAAAVSTSSLNDLERIVIYRIAEEALANAVLHSGAKTIALDIESDQSDLIIRVRDDGKGMARSLFEHPGRGLRYIMIRADIVGAIVGWSAGTNGQGTTCELRLPLPPLDRKIESTGS